MDELIAKIILSGSLIGVGTIIFRKMPVLAQLPEDEIQETVFVASPVNLIKSCVAKIKAFHLNLLLQKVLSKIRVLTLVVERKTEDKLRRLREESKRKKEIINDNYWEELKKAKKTEEDGIL